MNTARRLELPPPGRGEVGCACVAGASAVVRVAARSPLKLVVARERGPCARVHVSTFGGGLLAGDRISLELQVDPDATLVVGSAAPAKVYRADGGATSLQRVDARVSRGALLAWVPSAVTCFADARYRQEQHFQLEADASLLLVDTLSAGRVARGERWAFDACESLTRLWRDDQLVLHDGLRLAAGAVAIPARFGRFDALSTILFSGPRLAEAAARAVERVSALPLARRAPLVATAAVRDDGALVRVAGQSLDAVEQLVSELVAPTLARLAGDDPWHGPW
jgi:urease accessory protein